MSSYKQIWELSETVRLHHGYMQEMVKTLNQIVDNTNAMRDFLNLLAQRVNETESNIMDMARMVYHNPLGEPPHDEEQEL